MEQGVAKYFIIKPNERGTCLLSRNILATGQWMKIPLTASYLRDELCV